MSIKQEKKKKKKGEFETIQPAPHQTYNQMNNFVRQRHFSNCILDRTNNQKEEDQFEVGPTPHIEYDLA